MRRSILAGVAAATLALSVSGLATAGPLEDGVAAADRQDYPTALKLLRPLAEAGNPVAQFKLGYIYQMGATGAEDDTQALFWFRKAIAQDYKPAKAWLILLCSGKDAPAADCDAAYAEVRAKAEEGDGEARVQLGGFYMQGEGGVGKDTAKGIEWTRKAADQGFAPAQRQMGLYYSSSMFGVPADRDQALVWYHKAADQGDIASLDVLGMVYQNGLGAPKDSAQAAILYRKAAELGDQTAQSALADMYDKGDGVPQDPAEAFHWYRKVAEKGASDAEAKVGSAYALGKGVPQDYVQAYMWLDLAVLESDAGGAGDTALARDAVGAHITAAQREDAARQSAAMKAKIDSQP